MHHELEARLSPHNIQTGYDGLTFRIEPSQASE
jgi:hypothetical protein